MPLPNIFTSEVTKNVIERINQLKPETQPQWGKMSVSQMLAHCNVTYELVYDNKHPPPGFIMKTIMKAFVKNIVTSEKPYKRNSRTAPVFLIEGDRNFEMEKNRLTNHIIKTQNLGTAHFDNKESHSFGRLTVPEWNNMFYKHLDHHLSQFGV